MKGSADPGLASAVEPHGLTESEAAERRHQCGLNSVPEERSSPAKLFAKRLIGPVPWMLEGALLLELVQRRWVEAAIVAVLLFFNATLSFFQEHRAQEALDLLRQRLRVVARVKRDGAWKTMPAEELVPDDVVHVQLGDFVPADIRLFRGAALLDQSALTGESIPIEAQAGSSVYAGSIVRRGEATGVVAAIGARSYYGKTAQLVGSAKSVSQLEQLIRGIVTYLIMLDGLIAVLVLTDTLIRSLPLLDMLPFVLMLLVASVPLALPATFTLAGALGAFELAGKGVLVTRLSAIEEAAAMEVLCSDKTGTLTQNRLTLVGVHPRPPFTEDQLLDYAVLACDEAGQDPIDLAIRARRTTPGDLHRLSFVPFDPATKRASAVVQVSDQVLTVVKGAPLALAPLLRAGEMTAEDESVRGGTRVLAVAVGPESGLRLAGYLSFRDPVREDSQDSGAYPPGAGGPGPYDYRRRRVDRRHRGPRARHRVPRVRPR